MKVPESDLIMRLKKLVEENETVGKELESYKNQAISESTGDMLDKIKEVDGVKVLSVEVPGADPGQLRKVWDDVKSKIDSGIAVLGASSGGKAFILVGVTKDLNKKYHSGNIVKELAPLIGGKGGGRPDMAQAGGDRPEKLGDALNKVYDIIASV